MDNLDDALDSLGIEIQSNEESIDILKKEAEEAGIQFNDNERIEKQHKIFYGLSDADRDIAVAMSIVPQSYKDSAFNEDRIKDNLREQNKKSKGLYRVYNIKAYLETCVGILSSIRMRKLPARSYLIGAPNGFGKTSFVSECLITLNAHGYRVAPLISLWELAQIRVADEHRIMEPYIHPNIQEKNIRNREILNNEYYYSNPNLGKGYVKAPEIVTGKYSYSEYINADCLFVTFTDVISKDIESHTLYQLLAIRGAKGLPTIVLMSTSLEPYKNDAVLKQIVWDEILTYDENKDCYDRLYHVSCYKMKNIGIGTKGEDVDSNTGIVN